MADASASASPKKKVLILSWFYAQPKELELVRRIYAKKGYEVQIHESRVEEVARPRGWYHTYERYVKGDGISQELSDKIYKDWDIVHAMSGGFLNLALILAPVSKEITFKKLVLDSTPILPNPVSFVRFARAYMQENGLQWANKIVPERVQTGYQTARWSLGAAYVRSKHKLKGKFTPKRWLGMMPADTVKEMEEWTRWASHSSMLNRYEEMSARSIESIFKAKGLKQVTFLYNPKDPYLNQDDVQRCIDFASNEGLDINIVHSPCNHIETVFRKPKLLFEALAKEPAAVGASSASE